MAIVRVLCGQREYVQQALHSLHRIDHLEQVLLQRERDGHVGGQPKRELHVVVWNISRTGKKLLQTATGRRTRVGDLQAIGCMR